VSVCTDELKPFEKIDPLINVSSSSTEFAAAWLNIRAKDRTNTWRRPQHRTTVLMGTWSPAAPQIWQRENREVLVNKGTTRFKVNRPVEKTESHNCRKKNPTLYLEELVSQLKGCLDS
jgi:hypothetical protein